MRFNKDFNKNIKILIADDDPDCCSSLSLLLGNRGYRISTAENGTKAWEMVQELKPDIALIDIIMPGIDGLELTRMINEHSEFSETEVLIITARTSPEELRKGFEAGATDYIKKPYVNAEVIARTESAIRHKELDAELDRIAQLQSVQTSLNRINAKLSTPLKDLTTVLGGLRNSWRCEHPHHKQWVVAMYEEGIRMQLILKELQKIDYSLILDKEE